MSTILQEIVAHKHSEVAGRKQKQSIQSILRAIPAADQPRGFMRALRDRVARQCAAVIAEVKQASPSQGVIAADFDPVYAAQRYHHYGATCLSVLTDERYFKGCDAYLRKVRAAVPLPVLRKEFIVDEYQLAESRMLGADAILLIVAVLDDVALRDYTLAAHELGMDVLVEVHDAAEFERALRLPVQAVGVNNRNLHDFSVDLQTSIALARRLPEDYLLISESGIRTHADICRLRDEGIDSYLIGSSLMVEADPGLALHNLMNGECCEQSL